MKRISNDTASYDRSFCSEAIQKLDVARDVSQNDYVATTYDGQWWFGIILDISLEHEDCLVSFMNPHGPARSFTWPRRIDKCWIPFCDILRKVSTPITVTGRQYTFLQSDIDLYKVTVDQSVP